MTARRQRIEEARASREKERAIKKEAESKEREGRVTAILQDTTLEFPELRGTPIDQEGYLVEEKGLRYLLLKKKPVLVLKDRTELTGLDHRTGINRIPVVVKGSIPPVPLRWGLEGIWAASQGQPTGTEIRWISDERYQGEGGVIVGGGNAFYGYTTSPPFPGGEVSSMEEIVLAHPGRVAGALYEALRSFGNENLIEWSFIQEASLAETLDRVCVVLSLLAQHGVALQLVVPYSTTTHTPESSDGFMAGSTHTTSGTQKIWCFAPVQSTDPMGVVEGDPATFLD
jgi:hypothetical protein